MRAAIEFIGQHPFATGLLAILGVVGFAVSVLGFRLDRQESAETTEQLTGVEGQLGDIADDVARPWDGKPNFEGSWDEATAFALAWPGGRYVPGSYPEAEGGSIDSETPVLERAFFIPMRNYDARVLLTGLSEGTCNACGVQLSLFVFKKEDDTWYLDQEARNFVRVGQRGMMNFGDGLQDLQVWNVGSDRFGFVIPWNAWYQGDTTEGYEAYAFIADEMTKIFHSPTAHYFSGVEEEEARAMGLWHETRLTVDFDQRSSSFGLFDMVVELSSSELAGATRFTVPFDGQAYTLPSFDRLVACAEAQGNPPSLAIAACR